MKTKSSKKPKKAKPAGQLKDLATRKDPKAGVTCRKAGEGQKE
jgi:hypothetical protein